MADSGHQPSSAEAAWEGFDPGYSPYKGKADEMKALFFAAYACGWEGATEAAAGMPSFEHMEAVAKLSALRGAARAVAIELSVETMRHPEREQEWTAAFGALVDLLEEAAP